MLQALLRDIAVRAFDFSGADRKALGQGLALFQMALAGAKIPMVCADLGLLVARLGSFPVWRQSAENRVDAPRLQCVLCASIQSFSATASGAIAFAAGLKYSQT